MRLEARLARHHCLESRLRQRHCVQSAFATKQRHEEEVTAKASQALREAQEATGRADEGGDAAEAFLSSAARDYETISKASGANSVGSIAARAGRVLQSSWNEPDGAWQTLFGETFTATALVAVIRMFYAMHLSARGGGVEAPPLSASEAMESHKLERQLGWRRIGLNRKVNRVWTFVRGAEARGGLDLGVVASAGALPDVVSAILERLGIVDSMAMCDDWSRISSSVSLSDVGKTSKRSAVAAALYVYCACVDKAIRARVAEST